jgi:hypothetical protein
MKTAKDVLAALGLLLVGWAVLAMVESLGLIHLFAGGR